MKRSLIIIAATLLTGSMTFAQPAKRRTASSAASTTASATTAPAAKQNSDRASLQFPTSAEMPEDVVWKRDIYRQLDLMKDKNAPMYYPVEPIGKQVNLFTYLFRLIQTGRVTAYTYKLDGNESFEEKDKLSVKEMLERYNIYYEEKDGKIVVADADVPSAEATRYYIKESVYLDQRTGTFSTKVTALCPILMRGADEFSTDAAQPFPLFWLKYDDVAPWLAKLPMMGSNLNNVSNLTADDFFTLNRYEGKIYKTNNLQGKVLANYCETDSAMKKEQMRIEKQIADFEEGVWGHEIVDSTKLDSIALAEKAEGKTNRKTSSVWGKRSKTSSASAATSTGETKKEKSNDASPATARVSARRQRR